MLLHPVYPRLPPNAIGCLLHTVCLVRRVRLVRQREHLYRAVLYLMRLRLHETREAPVLATASRIGHHPPPFVSVFDTPKSLCALTISF